MPWTLGMRAIDDIGVARAGFRTTLTYALTDSLRAGVEWNPAAHEFGLLANWRLLDETENRPAFIVGTSSDRIGTEHGRAYYGTFSKNLEPQTGLPIAPYAGASWSGGDHQWRAIGGLNIAWSDAWTSTVIWDGENLHQLLDYRVTDALNVGLVLAEQEGEHHLGVSWSWSFGMGGKRLDDDALPPAEAIAP